MDAILVKQPHTNIIFVTGFPVQTGQKLKVINFNHNLAFTIRHLRAKQVSVRIINVYSHLKRRDKEMNTTDDEACKVAFEYVIKKVVQWFPGLADVM